MILIPKAVFAEYLGILSRNNVSVGYRKEYVKWLRYYLDFCAKYVITIDKSERLRLFIEKLRKKNQSKVQCERAAHAVSLYYQMQHQEVIPPSPKAEQVRQQPDSAKAFDVPPWSGHQRSSQYIEAGYQEKSDSPEWDAILAAMAAEIKVRHYSRKTLKTYGKWSRCFQRFLKNKPPDEVGTEDVREYLTFLAVKCHVAASTQNQAFNSILFLFRHGLKREFGELRGVPRAKKSLYIPVVLSREEIDCRSRFSFSLQSSAYLPVFFAFSLKKNGTRRCRHFRFIAFDRQFPYRVSCRYLIRWGWSAAAPSRAWRSSSYSE